MRFGIMAMQIETMIQPGKSLPEMMMSVMRFDHTRMVRQVMKQGFPLIELSADMKMLHPSVYSEETMNKLLDLKKKTGLSYTVHLPFWSIELSTPQSEVRDACIQTTVEAIETTLPLEPEAYVLHATGKMAAEFYCMNIADAARPYLLRHFQGHARDSVKRILRQSGLDPRRLAIENIDFPFDLTLEIAEDLNTSFCLDVGHALAGYSGPIDLFDALDAALPCLAEVHLHDSPWQGPNHILQDGLDHQALGRGDLDVTGFLTRLEDSGFDGPIVFELTIAEAHESLKVIEQAMAREMIA